MSTPQPIYLKDYQKPKFSITAVNLVFDLYEEYVIVTNTMEMVKKSDAQHLTLHAEELELLEIFMDDEQLSADGFKVGDNSLEVLDVPQTFTLKIVNKIYPQNNTELEGLYKSGSIFCTQNEPEGFRRITPYLDRPDVMSVFTTTIIADKLKYPILLSNGNKMQCHDDMQERHGVTWHDPHPKPSYLFALVAGDLGVVSDSFMTMQGNDVALNIYCDLGNESKCHHAMESLKKAMLWDEQKYGRAYDLEIYNIVAVDSFNMGAMENKGLNIFNSAYVLADKERATDTNFMGIESVIAHEYFHNWTGNRITCRDWFQLTLKEGLTVFRDQSFSADLNSPAVQRIDDVKALRERQFVEDASATRHPIQPKSYISMNNFYTATVYEKGAEVIRMLHTLLGEEKYRKAMDLYFDSFDGQAVTTDDFLWAMSKAGEIDLEQFKLWYNQSGTPSLIVEEKFHDGKYTLTLTQKVPDTLDGEKQKPYFYPLKIALFASNGELLEEQTLHVSQEKEAFIFDVPSQPILSINRDFSAPIIVEHPEEQYQFLMRYDTNSFTQYEAAQKFAVQTLESMMQGEEVNPHYIEAYGDLLKSEKELSFKALLLELPSENALMQRQEIVDFEPIIAAKEKLSRTLAQTFEQELLELYTQYHESGDALDAVSVGKRAVKNRVLRLLAGLEKECYIKLLEEQYNTSLTMTDKIAALDILENHDSVAAAVCMSDFYRKYHNDMLVMTKYFSIMASSSRAGLLARVQELENDPAYDKKVPNLVRALIGSFTRNAKYFHAKDGSGYAFVADKIIEIDSINAQMASSLATAFRIYPKMNETNKEQMEKALKRVVSTHKLSKNSFEIISKILKNN